MNTTVKQLIDDIKAARRRIAHIRDSGSDIGISLEDFILADKKHNAATDENDERKEDKNED